MKKSRKRIFLIVGTFILVIAAIAIYNFYPMLTMKPAETGEITDTGIVAVKNRMNSLYFIKSSGGYILVDAGSDVKAVEEALVEVNIAPSDVKHILLTHSDYDHVASLTLFSNAQIYMSEDELQMINGITKRNGSKYNSLPERIKQDNIVLLQETQELPINEHQITCIKAPGHTPGSMTYLLDDKYLFSGDAIRVSNNVLDVHPFTMDAETSKNTIQKLNDLIKNSEILFTAHYGYYKSDELKLD